MARRGCGQELVPRAEASYSGDHVAAVAHHVQPGPLSWQADDRGLRYPVQDLLELLSAGMTFAEVLEDYPDLEREDLLAALEFGALSTSMRRMVPLDAA